MSALWMRVAAVADRPGGWTGTSEELARLAGTRDPLRWVFALRARGVEVWSSEERPGVRRWALRVAPGWDGRKPWRRSA